MYVTAQDQILRTALHGVASIKRRELLALYGAGVVLIFGVVMLGTNLTKEGPSNTQAFAVFKTRVTPIAEPTKVQPTVQPTAAPTPSQEAIVAAEKIKESIASTPITLSFVTKLEDISKEVNSQEILGVLTTTTQGIEVVVEVDTVALNKIILEFATQINRDSTVIEPNRTYTGTDRWLDQELLLRTLQGELNSRRTGNPPVSVVEVLPMVNESAGSDGTLAPKYIEIDLSQQMLYQWEDGVMIKSRIISTGKRVGWTPVGVHKILNKSKNAWSPIASVWMPYWMAFGYNSEAGAYFGFHELPYWPGANGEIIRRPFDTLGVPVTGGCVQTNIGEAEELFNWAEVGIPVIVHE